MMIFPWAVVLRILAGLMVFILLILVVWMIIAGPQTVLRVIRYGDTKIDDYRHYPFRQMDASSGPYSFAEDSDKTAARLIVPVPPGEQTDLDELLQSNGTIALLVLKGDRLVLERYYQDHTPASLSQSFSMAKSFTSTLVGLAVADGLIQSVDQPVTEFIPELAQRGFDTVTIRHLLTMTSGSSYVENDNPFGVHVILNYTPNLEQRILGFRRTGEPGTVWRYKSGDNALLGLILSRVLAPKTISEYMQERLWIPMGMETAGLWSLDHENGLEKTWCCLSASARDYLKIGRLYLNNGAWQGRQILPQDWIHESTQVGRIPETAWDADFRRIGVWNYGYQWWLVSREEGSYIANGKDGQYLYINPAKDVAILRLGWSQGDLPLSQWLALFYYLEDEL